MTKKLKNKILENKVLTKDERTEIIKALEIVEEFEKAQIITGGRLNGRTYAYKCGLEDGKRKALEQQTSEDCVSRQAVLDNAYAYGNGLEPEGYCVNVEDIQSLPPVTPFPKGATNGDMIKAMFPDIKIHEHEKTDICDAYIQIDIWDFSICVSKDWWNAPYKRGNEDGSN